MAESPLIINPKEIAEYLESIAEPMRPENLPREIKHFKNCWGIYILSPLMYHELNIYLLPDIAAVKMVSQNPRPQEGRAIFGLKGEVADTTINGEFFLQGITEVSYNYNPKARWIDFRRETDEYITSLKVNKFGFPLSSFELK